MATHNRFGTALSALALSMVPAAAHAASSNAVPFETFLRSTIDFLTGTIGPLVIILGVVIGAICWILGARDGFMKCVYAVIGGVILFSAGSIVDFIARSVH